MSLSGALGRLAHLDLWHLGAALGCALVFYAADGLRFRIVLGALGHPAPARLGLRLTCVSYLASSVLPFDVLHLPAMVRVLAIEGVPRSDAATATAAKSALTTLAISALGLLALPTFAQVDSTLWSGVLRAWFLVVPATVALFLLWLFSRRPLSPAFALIAKGIALARLTWLPLSVATGAFIAAYLAVGAVLAEGVGLDLPLHHLIAGMLGGLAVAYLSPVPGSIGVAEAATWTLLGNSEAGLAVAVGQRLLCWYGAWIPGAAWGWRAVRRPCSLAAPSSPDRTWAGEGRKKEKGPKSQ